MAKLLTEGQVRQWKQDGFFIYQGLFDKEEVAIIEKIVKEDQTIINKAYKKSDGQGGYTQLTLWNKADDSVLGRVSRSDRIVDILEKLLEDEVYHYHSKVSAKKAREGGVFNWHQDYGYWYNNGCLFPQMASVFIAIDPNSKENGCLQVIKGSHNMGRVQHGQVGQQAGADMERVNEALKVLEKMYVELAPGDALFFHCNVLHTSDANTSDKDRYSLICCYNTKSNNPYKESHHPSYHKLEKVGHNAIKECTQSCVLSGLNDFLQPDKDKSIRTEPAIQDNSKTNIGS